MKTIILGFDAFDPRFFENLAQNGRLPNLSRFLSIDGYRSFEVSNPPQSEVSWTSIATGLNPGGHGIFDFVHRDPKSYTPFISMLPTKRGLSGLNFVPPFSVDTFFDRATKKGYPATRLFWPATFPAKRDSLVMSIPGLGTPDILGKLGVGTLFSTQKNVEDKIQKTQVNTLHSKGKNRYYSVLEGPRHMKGGKTVSSSIPVELVKLDEQRAQIILGDHSHEIVQGIWSPILDLIFNIGRFVKIHVITRAILTSFTPEINLYILPLQINPLHSPWPYATPPKFIKTIRHSVGKFLTIGWPQDTTALEEGCINDGQFLDLCESIFNVREQIFINQLDDFREGVLACVFDSLDRIQHMFWQDRLDIIEQWYIKLDRLVGKIVKKIETKKINNVRLLIVSDHGFSNFNQKIHLNRWLIDNDYLVPVENNKNGNLNDVDWLSSRAYGLGLNSLYINLAGREGKGIIQPQEVEPLTNQIKNKLLAWQDSRGNQVVRSVSTNEEAFHGSLTEYGPDLVIGYSPGFRASPQTGLGEWEKFSIEDNHDHWNADHCIDHSTVPGVLFSNQGLANFPKPSYRDFPVLAIDEELESGSKSPPPTVTNQDDDMLEDRLKSLGYL